MTYTEYMCVAQMIYYTFLRYRVDWKTLYLCEGYDDREEWIDIIYVKQEVCI